MRVAIRSIVLSSLALSTILASAQGMAASVEETLDKLNRLPASERQTTMEREARKEGRVRLLHDFQCRRPARSQTAL